jgi:hypothetical protein
MIEAKRGQAAISAHNTGKAGNSADTLSAQRVQLSAFIKSFVLDENADQCA